MTPEERILLFEVFAEGCNSQLPENVHISLDLLRRITGTPPAEALTMLRGMSSLGIDVKEYSATDEEADHGDDMIAVSWDNRIRYHDPDKDDFNMHKSTEVARAVLLGSSGDQCRQCAHEALEVVDLSALALPFDDD